LPSKIFGRLRHWLRLVFILIISFGLQSRAVYIFFFTVSKGLDQACTIQIARRAKLSKWICSGPQKSISFRCRDFVAVWKKL